MVQPAAVGVIPLWSLTYLVAVLKPVLWRTAERAQKWGASEKQPWWAARCWKNPCFWLSWSSSLPVSPSAVFCVHCFTKAKNIGWLEWIAAIQPLALWLFASLDDLLKGIYQSRNMITHKFLFLLCSWGLSCPKLSVATRIYLKHFRIQSQAPWDEHEHEGGQRLTLGKLSVYSSLSQWGGSGQIYVSDVSEIGSVLVRSFPGQRPNDATIPAISCLF